MIEKLVPFAVVLLCAFVLTFLLTPVVRELNRRLGMVDRPDPRRINKVPVPRGGGVALYLGVFVSYGLYVGVTGRPWILFRDDAHSLRMIALATLVFLLGLADDRFNLPAKLKFAGQLAIAAAVWAWGGLGFRTLWPSIPAWADCLMTVFWITGAVNAFNLIDGLDGLASGLALIATLGMAGSLMLTGDAGMTLFHFAFMGGLVGFLCFNYNPASVFLGDSGSMLIGFMLSTMPLATQSPNSFLVSVGVPLLAMGVPIFDTSLAIFRRSLRRLLARRDGDGPEAAVAEGTSARVMTADHDHLHHRILRAVGLNQRKAAWVLYLMALFLVGVGLIGMGLESRSAGLWLFAVSVAAVVVVRDMARIELFDAGRILNRVARDNAASARRFRARFAVPLYVVADIVLLAAAFVFTGWTLGFPLDRTFFRVVLPVRVFSTFFALVALRTYATVWSRAMLSNYLRLVLACAAGSVAGSVVIYYYPTVSTPMLLAVTAQFFAGSAVMLVCLRVLRPIVRDGLYAADCARLKGRKDVSRVLVYGAGLRYRAFRRELVRSTLANDRIIVGLLDDDIALRGRYIGGIRVWGTLLEAPEAVNRLNADAVVIACDISDEWLKVVKDTFRPTGVRLTRFVLEETDI